MKKLKISAGLILLLLIFGTLSAQKLHLKPLNQAAKQRKHPYTPLLRKAAEPPARKAKDPNFERLLVILVDFAAEDEADALITGNGSFELEPDPDYIYPIGAPPHDREYFEANLDAMRYYYLAVSAGSYELSYDVWPKDIPAYTLPHKMSYYNPPNASSELFVSRMEEYFKTAFELADAVNPEIDFGNYAHYMIIHAGSDWQHDAFGDSPSDLPSFYIRVGDGKEAVVNEGRVKISHACNVPETISQDFEITPAGGYNVHTGYGALNSVLFHEFGHSLGLVDLYNVRNFSPMVGVFDIMDSGGAGFMVDEMENGDLVVIEGVLPALPGAFSRLLLFEEDFKKRGLLKEISELPLGGLNDLAASSYKQTLGLIPTILRFQISEDEYFLMENRSVDPDGDGDTAVYGTLDSRVVLYPTPHKDDLNRPSYEYDYLLPSFVKWELGENGKPYTKAMGGGLLVWHVNEKVLYKEGQILADGSFWSNFANNTVNTDRGGPGVKVLEADGLNDIGNPYSMFWTGTEYEYFHARKPVLDKDGFFTDWSDESWRPTLGADTFPPLLSTAGLGSLYYLDDISDPLRVMQFRLRSRFFTQSFSENAGYRVLPAPPVAVEYNPLALPFFGVGGISLYAQYSGDWENLFGSELTPAWRFSKPLVATGSQRGLANALAGIEAKNLHYFDFSAVNMTHSPISFPEDLNNIFSFDGRLYVSTSNMLYHIENNDIADYYCAEDIQKAAAWQDKIALLLPAKLQVLSAAELTFLQEYSLPESFGDYDPVIWHHLDEYLIYLTSNEGNIYTFDGSALKRIFSNSTGARISQPALYQKPGGRLQLFFGAGNYAYLLRHNGLIEDGFPLYLDQRRIKPQAQPKALHLEGQALMYLPVQDQGYVAISESGEILNEYGLNYPYSELNQSSLMADYLHYQEDKGRFLWYHGLDEQVYIHSLEASANPILWQGWQNGSAGALAGQELEPSGAPTLAFEAYIYPNPVKGKSYRLRVNGAGNSLEYRIYNISGRLMQKAAVEKTPNQLELELDAAKLTSGVYILQLKSGKHKKSLKFAVEK